MENEVLAASAAATGIVVPWFIWVTVSIFNQRQELAVLKQILLAIEKKEEKK